MLVIRKGRSDEAANEAALPKDQSVAHGLGSRRCIPSIKQEAVRATAKMNKTMRTRMIARTYAREFNITLREFGITK